MSSRAEKRRHDRATAKLRCSVPACNLPVVWADINAPDPEYQAICAPHLGYALTTLFWGETIPETLPPNPRKERELPGLIAKARRDIARPEAGKKSRKQRLSPETCLALLDLDENPPELSPIRKERLSQLDATTVDADSLTGQRR